MLGKNHRELFNYQGCDSIHLCDHVGPKKRQLKTLVPKAINRDVKFLSESAQIH